MFLIKAFEIITRFDVDKSFLASHQPRPLGPMKMKEAVKKITSRKRVLVKSYINHILLSHI